MLLRFLMVLVLGGLVGLSSADPASAGDALGKCWEAKLKAAGRTAKKGFHCSGKALTSGGVTLENFAAMCTRGGGDAFFEKWDRAEQKAAYLPSSCFAGPSPESADEQVTDLASDVYQEHRAGFSGADNENPDAVAILNSLMKASGKYTAKILICEAKDAAKPDLQKRDACWAKALAAYEKAHQRSVDRAAAKGVGFAGAFDATAPDAAVTGLADAVSLPGPPWAPSTSWEVQGKLKARMSAMGISESMKARGACEVYFGPGPGRFFSLVDGEVELVLDDGDDPFQMKGTYELVGNGKAILGIPDPELVRELERLLLVDLGVIDDVVVTGLTAKGAVAEKKGTEVFSCNLKATVDVLVEGIRLRLILKYKGSGGQRLL